MAKASGVSSAASELVVMATQLRDHARSRLHRSALAHAAGEVIRAHGDAAVRTAIERAPDLKVARTIRHAAEAACETVSTGSHGVERQARLFSIALIVRFPEPLTAREFGDRFAPILDTGSLLARVQECGMRCQARSFIWPQVWTFDDLSRLSLGDVRQWTIMASSTSAGINGGMPLPFPPGRCAQRHCATFLRYLVGYQVGNEAMLEDDSRRVAFADCVRSVMRTSLPEVQDVAVMYDRCFYGPLWDGLRAYQGHRLAEVVAMLAARGITASQLAASFALTGSRNETRAQIAFFGNGKKLEQHVYRLVLEPQADPEVTLAPIVASLRSAGVKAHITRPVTTASADRRVSAQDRRAARRFTRFEFTLPL